MNWRTADGAKRGEMNQSVRQNLFPDSVVQLARKVYKEGGCPASVTLAQWALESGYGKHLCAPNNPFGIKWYQSSGFDYAERSTREFVGGKWKVEIARFIAFPSLLSAFIYHSHLLMNPKGPYHGAAALRNNWRAFVHAIAHTYATDPHYENKIVGLIEQYSLCDFDA